MGDFKNKFLSIEEITEAVNGKAYGCNLTEVCGVSTDSRDNLSGKLFVPLKGLKFDGHNFIAQAFENGAACCLTEHELQDCPNILVKSTQEALLDLAEYYRGKFCVKVVAITGSSGKTTTKDMIFSVLAEKYRVLKTEGNFNNEIGLPLTVFKLDENFDCAALEMGMNQFNEIHRLSKVARPDICVITNVGHSHIENLGSREGILQAKCEIFDFCKPGALGIINGDDDMLCKLRKVRSDCIFFGLKRDNEVYADNILQRGLDGVSATIHYKDYALDVNISIPGEHMVYNAACAAAVGFKLGLNAEQIKRGIENFVPTKMRMNILKMDNGMTMINDAYNANPASVKAALDVIAGLEGEKLCILGDMFELGSCAGQLHREVGEYVIKKGIPRVICVGQNARYIYEEIKGGCSEAWYFKNQEEMLENLSDILSGLGGLGTVLVKASRGMMLEAAAEWIIEWYKSREFKDKVGALNG